MSISDEQAKQFAADAEHMARKRMSSDTSKRGCEICSNSRGGVVGNEQIVDGTSMCDYCHADHLRFPRFWEDRFSTPRTDAAAVGFGRLLVDYGTPKEPKFTTTELVPAHFARQLERELFAMTARAEAAERDAERYRWLRNQENDECCVSVWWPDRELEPADAGNDLDAAIDAAIAKESHE